MIQRFLFISAMVSACLFTSCNRGEYYYVEGLAQGTSYHITYKGTKNYTHEIDSILKAFDKSLSDWDSTSIIHRINHNDTTVVADSLFTLVFNKALQVNHDSNGAFDITVGPLVKAWGFYKKNKSRPDSATIKNLLQNVGMEKVRLEHGKVIKQRPGIILDVNAIAQGFSVDVVTNWLERRDVKNYIVEIGGELKAKGKNREGNTWRVGIDKPIDGNQDAGSNLQTIVQLNDKAMATSGNYRKYVVENGVKYAHHLNPKTGYPSKNTLLSVSIIADQCMTADASATACIVSGLEKAKAYLQAHPTLEAYLIYSDTKGNFQVYITEGLKKMVKGL
jgi:FAD:protein FMN transferase